MSQSFIEFFEKLRDDSQVEGTADPRGQSIVIGDVEEEDAQETVHPLLGSSTDEEQEEEEEEEEVPLIDWDEVKQSTRLGPLLSSLREEQEKQPMSQRETYSVEHLKRLYQFVPKRAYSKPRANKLCSKVHPKPCPYQCKSCHFCRQRTTEPKTVCSVCDGVNNYYGGPARGFWCGSCLWLRIGENIDEVRERDDWICPACRDICNCSGANCMRIKRGWFPTNQLSHEAKDQGYKSVAHYLVLTHLSEQASAAPMDLILGGTSRRRRKQPSIVDITHDDEDARDNDTTIIPKESRVSRHRIQKKLPLQYVGKRTRKEALEMASKPRVQREIIGILKDLGSENNSSILDRIIHQADGAGRADSGVPRGIKSASTFLCILDHDMKDEDEEEHNKPSLPPPVHSDIHTIRNTMYSDGGAQHTVHRVVVRGQQPVKRGSSSSIKVGDQMLPPKEPDDVSRSVRQRLSSEVAPRNIVSPDEDSDILVPGEQENVEPRGVQPGKGQGQSPVPVPALIIQEPPEWFLKDLEAKGIAVDEFIWNGLCLRALSIVDAVKTFYAFHPDVLGSHQHLIDAISDKSLYESIYESTRSNLQKVLRSAEALSTEDASIQYASGNIPEGASYPGTLRTVGGVRRAVQLLTYLSRILPEADIRWRIEKRLLGLEPFADFQTSSPHAKAVILRGRLEFIAILEKRRMYSSVALENLGNTLGAIATDMKAALPLLDSIIENKAMPTQDFTISGWSYNDNTREKRIVDIFTDVSVLYASLHEVLFLGIQRTSETCSFIGPRSFQILTDSLIDTLLDVENSFPESIVKEGFGLVCTVIDLAFTMFEDQNIDMTVGERNMFLSERNAFLDFIEGSMIPRLETLVQKDYNMWGKTKQSTSNAVIPLFRQRAESMGSEKVEVLARCYALQLKAGRVTWPGLESKATEPYSFSQYWKYANLRYRRFSLYLLSHTLEKSPSVLEQVTNLPSILRMWLLSVLDFGRHECSWYLTSIIAKYARDILGNMSQESLDFRADSTGKKSQDMLRQFAQNIMNHGQFKTMIAGVVLLLDECLQERQREIIQTSFNANKSLLKWQRLTALALLGFLEPLAPIMCSQHIAGKELRKLLRRCVIWTIESFWMIKQQSVGDAKNDMNQIGGEMHVEMLSNEGDIRQELDLSVCGELSSLVSLVDALRIQAQIQDSMAIEFMEPLWILILGVSELGDGGTLPTPFESVMYDKVAASLFEARNQITQETETNVDSTPLHEHVLGVHLRRALTKTSFRHQQSERLGVNAMRFAHAIFSRPEMRSLLTFKASFDLMMTTWISLLSQSGDSDSLAVRHEFLNLLMLSIKLHPESMPGYEDTGAPFGHAYHLFWKSVCCDFLRLMSKRFPEVLLPSISMEAEYLYCQMLPSYSGIELFTPSTPVMLSEAYNYALGEFGRPPSWIILDNIHSNLTLSDILPRTFGMRQAQTFGNFRPGDFGWTVSKSFLLLLRFMARGPCREANPHQSPSIWYSLCCTPYLESIYRKGERASLLIEAEYNGFIDSLEQVLSGIRMVLKDKRQNPQVQSVDIHLDNSNNRSDPSAPINNIDQVNDLTLGTIFSISSCLVKVRKLERDGVKVAVCSLCNEASNQNAYFNVLVSKPPDLVELLLDSNMPSTLPRRIQINDIEFVRRKAGTQIAVARSTPSCTIQLSGNQGNPSNDPLSSNFVETSRRLQGMGYATNTVMHYIKQIQRETQGGPPLSTAAIVSRIVEKMNHQ